MIKINPSNQFFKVPFESRDIGDFFVNTNMENPCMYIKINNIEAIDLISKFLVKFKHDDIVIPVNVEINFEYMMMK